MPLSLYPVGFNAFILSFLPADSSFSSSVEALLPGARPLAPGRSSLPAPPPPTPLPDPFVRSARALCKALTTTLELEADGASELEVRRSGDAAKRLVKDYVAASQGAVALGGPVGDAVADSEAFVALGEALRELSAFYQKSGPRAAVDRATSGRVLAALARAEAALPAERRSEVFGVPVGKPI